MIDNDILKQITDTIRSDIFRNRDFLASLLQGIELNEKNIPKDLIYQIMNERTIQQQQQAPRPKTNGPKNTGAVARPIAMGVGDINSQIVSDLIEGNNVYMLGKAGTGKTYLAKALAESILGQPVYQINCSKWTSPIEIRGGQTITGYEEGQLIKAWADGGVLLLDELPKLDPNTAGLLNEALADAAAQPKYENGLVVEKTIPTITNGRGEKIKKGQNCTDDVLEKRYDELPEERKAEISKADFIADNKELRFRFCVVGTGNTDMMTVGNLYAGNQKQDYSLIDRFAGSFYELKKDTFKERLLTYEYVFAVCDAMRDFLEENKAPQSISIRTMLSFNRTYEQQMLYSLSGTGDDNRSPFADKIMDGNGFPLPPKTISDSIDSFLSMLEPQMRINLENDGNFLNARGGGDVLSKPAAKTSFIKEFKMKYRLDPQTGKELTQDEYDKVTGKKKD